MVAKTTQFLNIELCHDHKMFPNYIDTDVNVVVLHLRLTRIGIVFRHGTTHFHFNIGPLERVRSTYSIACDTKRYPFVCTATFRRWMWREKRFYNCLAVN